KGAAVNAVVGKEGAGLAAADNVEAVEVQAADSAAVVEAEAAAAVEGDPDATESKQIESPDPTARHGAVCGARGGRDAHPGGIHIRFADAQSSRVVGSDQPPTASQAHGRFRHRLRADLSAAELGCSA